MLLMVQGTTFWLANLSARMYLTYHCVLKLMYILVLTCAGGSRDYQRPGQPGLPPFAPAGLEISPVAPDRRHQSHH